MKKVVVCGVAARTLASARAFGKEIHCDTCFSDFRELINTAPDAVLIEVPHGVQDEIVLWVLKQEWHVLIGGCLASTSAMAKKIGQIAAHKRLIVETGYEARYSAMWEAAKRQITGGVIGQIVAVRSIALWNGAPTSWYYQQQASGGMPLTHMTYCFISPIRWIIGDPLCVSAFANRIKHTGPGLLEQETCVANLLFSNKVLCTMTASFIKPGDVPGWSVMFLGTQGALELFPEQNTLTLYRDKDKETQDFSAERDPFEVQAEFFLAALEGCNECRNTPRETATDVHIAEAIVASCRKKATVWLGQKETLRAGHQLQT